MTNNDELALKTRKDFEAYYNETHALKATSQFKRFGYYVSPTMQKAWELWQAAQSSLLAERDADKKRIAELTHNHRVHAARLIDERARLKERIAELEARMVSVKFPERCNCCYSEQEAAMFDGIVEEVTEALESACAAASIKLEVGE